MGLATWRDAPDGKIKIADVIIAKNCLSEFEIGQSERMAASYLGFAEQGWETRLNTFIETFEYGMFKDAGKATAAIAKLHPSRGGGIMLGAIVGDIVGSRFEFNNHRSKDFDLFGEGCFATDDSIMTLAVAKAIMEASKTKNPDVRGRDHDFHARLSRLTVKYMREIGRKYPDRGFGGMFYRWVFSDDPKPYNSFGNGAAMRVSPAGFAARSEKDAEQLAETVTAVTHNHDEGIKGAKATAAAIYMAHRGAQNREIRERIAGEYYPLDFTIDSIRPTYRFNETCQGTVPQAIECFLESVSFEDAIRIAISLGGDSDTIGAITGAIAEARYGAPEDIKRKAFSYLDAELRAIYDEWEVFAHEDEDRRGVLMYPSSGA
jgi:type I restriction enzyme M protein